MKSYNVRIYDNEDGTLSLGFVLGFKPNRSTTENPKGEGGQWVDRSPKTIKRLIEKGKLV